MAEETEANEEVKTETVVGSPVEVASEGTDWKAQARKWEARAKENRDAAQMNEAAARELEAIKLERMSELERAQAETAQAQARAVELEAERDRLAVIAKHSIPTEYANLITGDDLEGKAKMVENLIAETQRPKTGWVGSGEKALPDSLAGLTYREQIQKAADAGDHASQRRLKLLALNNTGQ